MIGTTLGRYRIVAKLGEGGMGSVWRAEDPALGRTVALKLLAPTLLGSDDARRRFLREARAAGQLDHPHIATVYDVGETDGHAWIATRFVDGESVAARTERGPLPLAEAVSLAREVAAALAHAHARGVLHRDVTAGNVMVTRDGHAVLVDFGLARPERATQLTHTGAMLGTAGYIAPELLRGQPADARSDLYGLGAVLHRMLTGRLPFEGGPAEAMLYRALNEPVPPPSEARPEMSPALERVVLRLLAREPADRHASAVEAEEALASVATATGPSAAEQGRREWARRWRAWSGALRKMGRARVGVAALAAVVLLASSVWFAAQRGWLPGTKHGPPVIAVLPFQNTSVVQEDAEFLGEGLGDELVLKLGEVGGYRVLPWATTRAARRSGEDLRQLARRLGASALVVGTFRSEEERVRVTASLVDGKSGVQSWSRSFDVTLDDLMRVQSGIAAGVASELRGELASDDRQRLDRQPSTSPEAYALYLQGATYLNSSDPNTQAMAAPFFEKALEVDADLAEAYVGLGATQLDRYFRGDAAGAPELASAEAHMRRALALRPGFARAQKGVIKVAYLQGRFRACLDVGEAAARRGDEDVEGLLVRGWACMLGGLPEVAVPLLERVLELDRNNREAAWFLVISLAWSGRMPEALERGKAFIRTFGEDPEVYTWMAVCASAANPMPEARAYSDRALELFGDAQSNLYSVVHAMAIRQRMGDMASAKSLAATWQERVERRLQLAPDNDRLVGLAIEVAVVLEDHASVHRHSTALIQLFEANPSMVPDGTAMLLPALCRAGEMKLVRRMLSAAQPEDAMVTWGMLRPAISLDHLLGPCAALEALPEYRELVSATHAAVEAARERYTRSVGLRPRPGSTTVTEAAPSSRQ
jgi:serine/threonine-protein kinase